MRRWGIAITLGAALLSPGAAQAAAPRCGETVTSDTTLTRALRCTGDGLTVASGVTLDLGSHTLYGSGAGTGVAPLAGATSATAACSGSTPACRWEATATALSRT